MSNGEAGEKSIDTGEALAQRKWRDLLGNREDIVETDEQGHGQFFCNAGSVSVWVLAE